MQEGGRDRSPDAAQRNPGTNHPAQHDSIRVHVNHRSHHHRHSPDSISFHPGYALRSLLPPYARCDLCRADACNAIRRMYSLAGKHVYRSHAGYPFALQPSLHSHAAERPLGFRPTNNSALRAFDAVVVLPDHLHCIWTLPPDDGDYSLRWREIKSRFSRRVPPTARRFRGRVNKMERGIWPRRRAQ